MRGAGLVSRTVSTPSSRSRPRYRDAGTAQTAAGYHVCLDHLARLLDTGSAPSVADADPSALEARYAEAVSAAAPQ